VRRIEETNKATLNKENLLIKDFSRLLSKSSSEEDSPSPFTFREKKPILTRRYGELSTKSGKKLQTSSSVETITDPV
jgi:hypothetical protein